MSSEICLVQTKCTPLIVDKRPPFQVFVHSSNLGKLPAGPKRQKQSRDSSLDKESKSENPELEMKRVRYEVMRFSNSKLEGDEREEADVALAVSLGAKPPKKQCVNYKELINKKKESKNVVEVQSHCISKLKAKLSKGRVKKGSKEKKRSNKTELKDKKKPGILEKYGKPSKKKGKKMKSKEMK